MKLPRSLVEGYWRFRRDRHGPERGRYEQLAALGQAPAAMVIACCDARVDVSAIFDAGPGELFLVRNIANLVPPFEPAGRYHGTSAAIEYAVTVLRVPHMVVLGHSHCGGIGAYGDAPALPDGEKSFIGRWLTLLNDAVITPLDEKARPEKPLELAGIRMSLGNLRTFPFLREREEEGLLVLHGLHFDVSDARLMVLDEATGAFESLADH